MEWNGLTRLSQDYCTQTLTERQSQMSGQYKVQTPGFRWCESANNYAQLMSEPAHYYKVYRNGCFMDADSDLRFSDLTNKRYIHQLFARPYMGSFMGAGQRSLGNKNLESELIYGLDTRGYPRRACDVLSGVSIDAAPWQCLPEFGNPQRVEHIIEPWVRGGDHTRDYVRRINYERQCLNRKNNRLINGAVYPQLLERDLVPDPANTDQEFFRGECHKRSRPHNRT